MKKLFKEENYQATRIRMFFVALKPRFEFLYLDLVKLALLPCSIVGFFSTTSLVKDVFQTDKRLFCFVNLV